MRELLPDLVIRSRDLWPDRPALIYKDLVLTYDELWSRVEAASGGFRHLDLAAGERVGLYLEKRDETVIAMFGASAAGGVFVPINPLLRPPQVAHILRDCGVRVLVTSADRLRSLEAEIESCPDLGTVVLVDADAPPAGDGATRRIGWQSLVSGGANPAGPGHRVIANDMAAILYTSGSTGKPKGVVLSHRNLVAGAKSVSSYLENNEEDRILSVLPLSFDAGLSQLTTAFNAGARVVLMNYLLPRDVVQLCTRHGITGMTCVPPLWIQLSRVEWPEAASGALRYFANTGGHMPRALLDRLRSCFPKAKPYLMYGLTEAFRSTYLDPSEVDRRPGSIGKAIPNEEVLVVTTDGRRCAPGEHGELVHRGALVALGYWNNPEATARRFRPAPGRPDGLPLPEMAVWSGDLAYTDEEGFLYFVGRQDDMIKTSGYRVSPAEIEEVVYATGMVGEAAALGIPHPELGHGIVVVASPRKDRDFNEEELLEECRKRLPLYMVPRIIARRPALPHNQNGKIDRPSLAAEFAGAFEPEPEVEAQT